MADLRTAVTAPQKEMRFLAGDVLHGWRMVQSLPVSIQWEPDGSFMVSDDVFLVYGVGDTRDAALHDYSVVLTEYYELVEAGAHYNPHYQAELQTLHIYIQRQDVRSTDAA